MPRQQRPTTPARAPRQRRPQPQPTQPPPTQNTARPDVDVRQYQPPQPAPFVPTRGQRAPSIDAAHPFDPSINPRRDYLLSNRGRTVGQISYQPTYWENPDKIVNWYNKVQTDPNAELPAGMDRQTLEGSYNYLKFRNQNRDTSAWFYLPETDPMREFLQSIPAPTNKFLAPDEITRWGEATPEEIAAQTPGGTSQMDYTAPDFDWTKLTVEQKQTVLNDPNFAMSKVVAPGQQGLVLSDPTFDFWGKAKRGELPWWQPFAFSVLSNPKTTPLVQGAAMTLMTGGKGLAFAVPMTLLGYGAQSDNPVIRIPSETLLKPFMWGSQTVEQAQGLSQYLSAGSKRLGHAPYTPEELKVVQERTKTFMQHPKEVWAGLKVYYETMAGEKVWVLGEGEKVQVQPGYTLEDAVKRVVDGESADNVLADYTRMYGINGVASDFLLQSVYDPLNVAPEIVGEVRAGGAERAGLKATAEAAKIEGLGVLDQAQTERVAQLQARAQIEQVKAATFRGTSATTGLAIPWGEAGREFKALVQSSLPPEYAKYLTKWERTVAGLTPDGKVKELLPASKTPTMIETMVTLQPKARAKLFLEKFSTSVASLFDWGRMTDASPGELVKVLKATGNMDMPTLKDMGAEFMNTPEAYTTIGAVRDALPKLDRAVNEYEAAAPNRDMFWQVQSVLGDQPKKILADFLDGDPRPDFQRLTDSLRSVDTPEAKTLLAEIDAGNLTPEKLTEMFKPFRDGNIAIHPQEFMAKVLNTLDDHMKTWGRDYFQLKKDSVWDDSLRLLKGAQSLLLLDMSPSAIVNDFLNERIMMVTTGTLGLTPPKVIDAWIKDFGLTPKEAGYGLLGDLPRVEGDVVSQMTRGDSAIGSTADAINKARSYLLRPQASSRFNAEHARQMYYSHAKTFWSRNWFEGKGFDRMPPALEGRLREYGLDPNLVYKNLRGVFSTRQLDLLKERATNYDVSVFVDDAAGKLGKNPADVSAMLEQLGVLDDLRARLERAKTPEQRRTAFDAITQKALENNDIRQAQGLRGLLEQYRNKIKTEGPAGVVHTFNEISLDYFDRKVENDRIWDDAFAQSEKTTDYSLRQQIKRRAARENSEAWRRVQSRQAALYTAAIEGLGMDTEFKRAFLAGLSDQHNTLREYFRYKNQQIERFFNTDFPDQAARSREWYNLEADLNERFASEQNKVLKVQGDMNALFVDEMKRTFGDGGGAMAKVWTDSVLKISTDIHQTITAFRDSIKGQTQTERAAAWQTFKPEYRKMWMERLKADMDGAGNLYRWDRFEGGEPTPTPTEPTPRPPEGTPPTAREVEADKIRTEAEAALNQEVGRIAEIDRVAGELGFSGSPQHLVKAVRKYLGEEARGITSAKQLTPDMVQRALAIRNEVKVAEAVGAVPPSETAKEVHFDNLNQSLDDALAAKRYTTQEKKLTALDEELNQLWLNLPDNVPTETLTRLGQLQDRVSTEIRKFRQEVSVAEEMTRAQADMKAQEDAGQIAMTRQLFRDQLETTFDLTPEMADAVATMTDAHAGAWAKVNNSDPAEWYGAHLQDVVRGGEGTSFEQGIEPINRRMTPTEISDYARALVRSGADELRRAVTNETNKADRVALLDAAHQLNPKLAEEVAKKTSGILYQDGHFMESGAPAKGAVTFLDDGKAIIHAFESADVSTVVHELGHIFRRDLQGEDLTAIEQWAGVRDGNWERTHEEKFARAFEKYLADGEAPTPQLRTPFQKFANWLAEIYKGITGSSIDIKLTDEVRAVFDRMLGKEEEKPVKLDAGQVQKNLEKILYQEDYFGEHRPIGPEGGAPLHDLTGGGTIYPDDVYSSKAAQYYGTGNNAMDRESFAIANRLRNNPNGKVTIYRAIPDDITVSDRIAKLETQKAYILKKGKIPPEVETNLSRSDYYDKISADLDNLKAQPQTTERAAEIYPGDWVTINKSYAKEHGESALRGNYRILSKTVKAKEIYTNGDSIHEWGYWPQGDKTLYQSSETPIYPPGGYEQATGYIDYSKILLDGFNEEVRPVLDAMKESAAQPRKDVAFSGMDAETQAGLNRWLTDVRSKMATAKHMAKNYAEAQRDFALLDYSRQYGFDKPLSAVVPYEFFGVRSAANWLTRVADRPAWISQYSRLMNLHNTYQSQLPERMRNKIYIPMPFLPEWAGGGVFVDPTYQAFPFKQFLQPLEAMRRDQATISNNAQYVLRNWADDGTITPEQADEAINQQGGPMWERAVAQAKQDQGENATSGYDYMSMLLSPALYLTVPYYLATGKKAGNSGWPSGQLPITRFGQGLETAFKGTPLQWAGDLAGNLAKPEKWVREAKGLNEFGEWGDFYIDRQLANMVAEGTVDEKTAQAAMIERTGDTYNQAVQRVREELMLKVPGMAPLYGLSHGATLDKVVGSVLPSLFPGGLLPPGEMEYKGLKQEYSLAWDAYKAGNKKALSQFFDDHPEYQARLALRRDPAERMQQFLKSEIWDAYTALGTTDRKQAVAFMGPDFQDFMDSDPGVEFSTEQLATWAKMLGGMVPQTTQTHPVLEGQTPQIDYFSPEVTKVTDRFFQDRKENFPHYYQLQSAYYALPKSERARFLLKFPELKAYWDYKDKYYKDYPELKPVLSGEVFRRVDTTNWPPALLTMVQTAALTGDDLPDGARQILAQIWEQEGKPYDDLGAWIESQVYPSMVNQMTQDATQP